MTVTTITGNAQCTTLECPDLPAVDPCNDQTGITINLNLQAGQTAVKTGGSGVISANGQQWISDSGAPGVTTSINFDVCETTVGGTATPVVAGTATGGNDGLVEIPAYSGTNCVALAFVTGKHENQGSTGTPNPPAGWTFVGEADPNEAFDDFWPHAAVFSLANPPANTVVNFENSIDPDIESVSVVVLCNAGAISFVGSEVGYSGNGQPGNGEQPNPPDGTLPASGMSLTSYHSANDGTSITAPSGYQTVVTSLPPGGQDVSTVATSTSTAAPGIWGVQADQNWAVTHITVAGATTTGGTNCVPCKASYVARDCGTSCPDFVLSTGNAAVNLCAGQSATFPLESYIQILNGVAFDPAQFTYTVAQGANNVQIIAGPTTTVAIGTQQSVAATVAVNVTSLCDGTTRSFIIQITNVGCVDPNPGGGDCSSTTGTITCDDGSGGGNGCHVIASSC